MSKSLGGNSGAEYRRKAVAARRFGKNAICAQCGETRPEALIRGSKPRICAACQRKNEGKAETDRHHVAGQNNHPATVPVSVNDHRARLGPAQQNWPSKTLKNPDKSPLLAEAAAMRGFKDYVEYCNDQLLHPERLEVLDNYLVEKLGPGWSKDALNYLKSKKHSGELQ